MLNIIQHNLMPYMEREMPVFKLVFEKSQKHEKLLLTHAIKLRMADYPKEFMRCFVNYRKTFSGIDSVKLWNGKMEVSEHLTEALSADQETTVSNEYGDTALLQVGKRVRKICICIFYSNYFLNIY